MALEGRAAVRDTLTRDEAAARSAEISHVHYAVDLDVTAGERTFMTSTVVRFQARTADAVVFLDFAGAVESVECNGRAVPDAQHGPRVRVTVRPGVNEVRVTGTAPYSRTGEGLHRFRDPLDGEVYLHTKFEPFAAHRVFACFDQPDLKATVELTVTAEEGWVVVANTDPVPVPLPDGRSTWRFGRTPPLPPYLVAFCAGPFRRLRSSHHGVPLALYARNSLFAQLRADAPEIFEVLGRGLDHYRRLFGLAYPFAKYDHVFAPEYAFGGMEHPGCVTLNERFLFAHRVIEDKRRRRAEVLLHEMAHMWFGDYVTLRWWDDLWLNEAFAELMSVHAQTVVTPYGDGWTAYTHHALPAARHADRLPTSHAIRVDTPDTDAARVNFGPIVYKRGAAVLHDLAERVGWTSFAAGVRAYLRAHAWGNAGLEDFVAALRQVSDGVVDRWVTEWLLRPGVNTVEVSRREGRVRQLSDPDVAPRHLKLTIAAYDDRDGKLLRVRHPRVSLTPWRLEATLDEFGSPDLLVPNADAAGHVKVRLDPRSRRTALRGLSTLDDPRARAVVWGALWDDVLDARLPARAYAQAVLTHGPRETDGVVEALLERAVTAVQVYGAADFPLAHRLHEQLADAAAGSDRQLVLARALVSAVADHGLLAELGGGRSPWPGLDVDRDLRWRALVRLAATGGELDGLLDLARAADPGDSGRRNALEAEAARPTAAAKEQAWTRLFGDDLSLAEKKAVLAGFRQPGQEAVLTPYADRYLRALADRVDGRPEFVLAFAHALFPRYTFAEQRVLADIGDLVASEVLSGAVVKVVREERAELLLARAARACDTADLER
ncbi:aminopeptidase N [Amycolatopsis rhabdoformis]|uniref:Aminopeptidase N n=1 Tax=Amycolatopsis rhabdoformis TaxID=1448059 RepID=A0ABZ1IK61_9PSEU|nr:aminopeptidase N [Amycolatopsis rhabdoformis]WSE34550.1 aminopeptidase N [Amycolatopsis rhabdoformis]